jgi:hypothetical protein
MSFAPGFKEELERVKRGDRVVFVDSWANTMTEGQSGSPFGFHLDGARKNPLTRKADLSWLDRNNGRMYLCLVGDSNGVSSTDFFDAQVKVPKSEIGKEDPWKDLHQHAKRRLVGSTRRRPLPYGMIGSYTGESIHSAQRTTLREGAKKHTRRLTRVSFLDVDNGITPLNELRDPDWMQAREVDPNWVY